MPRCFKFPRGCILTFAFYYFSPVYSTIFQTVFKRNSVYVGTIFGTAFVFQTVFDDAINGWWETRNKGKLWKDVKVKLAAGGDADDGDDDE